MASHILIITYYWPPSGGPGVQRWLKFVKYLPEFGLTPIVITVNPEKAEYPVRDTSLSEDIAPDTLVFPTDSKDLYSLYKKFTKSQSAPYSGFVNEAKPNFKQKIARFIRGNFFIPDARKGWNKYAYRKAEELITRYDIKTVITTGPPMSTHLIGLKLKKMFPVKWVADFRDPWTDIYYYDEMYPTFLAKAIDKKYEKNVLTYADHIIAVSDFLTPKLLKINPGKLSIIPNGYDEEDFNFKTEKDPVFTITYTGTLSYFYPIDTFLECVAEFSKNTQIRLRFVGKTDKASQRKIIDTVGNITEFVSFVPHSAAIRYLKQSTLLLLVIPHIPGNSDNILTGKLFEYLGSQTPILGLGPVSGDASRIIRECHAGNIFDYNDKESILYFLKDIHRNYTEGKLGNTSGSQRYSRKSLTGTLSQILKDHEN